MPRPIYLVEEVWYTGTTHLAAYDCPHTAIEHAQHPVAIKEHGVKSVSIREIGVRSRLQFKKPHERIIFADGRTLVELPPRTTTPETQ